MKEFELEPGEHVVLQARKHWFVFAADLLPYAIMAVFPFVIPKVIPFIPPLTPYSSFFTYQDAVARALLGAYLLLVWTIGWGSFTRYFLNAWILTNQRIVTIKQRKFFVREVSSLLLTRVQDVSTSVTGVVESFLGFGNIKVQSAGADVQFTMRSIPNPEVMRNIILKYIAESPKSSD